MSPAAFLVSLAVVLIGGYFVCRYFDVIVNTFARMLPEIKHDEAIRRTLEDFNRDR